MYPLTLLGVILAKFVINEVTELPDSKARFEEYLGQLAENASCTRLYANATASHNNSDDMTDHIVYCIAHGLWTNHSDDHTALEASQCDRLMTKPFVVNWTALDAVTRQKLTECAHDRLRIAVLRASNATRYGWLPADVSTSPRRPYLMLLQTQRALNTWMQYDADHTLAMATVLDTAYHRMWHEAGLYTAHYATMRDCQSLKAFRANHTVKHYMMWNQVTRPQLALALRAYKGIATGLFP